MFLVNCWALLCSLDSDRRKLCLAESLPEIRCQLVGIGLPRFFPFAMCTSTCVQAHIHICTHICMHNIINQKHTQRIIRQRVDYLQTLYSFWKRKINTSWKTTIFPCSERQTKACIILQTLAFYPKSHSSPLPWRPDPTLSSHRHNGHHWLNMPSMPEARAAPRRRAKQVLG